MRITFNMQANRFDQSISGSLSTMTTAADRVTAKRNLLTPEENATNYIGAYNVQRMIDEMTQFGKNAQNASNWLQNADTQIQAALKILSGAKNDMAIAGASSDKDAASRLALAGSALNAFSSLMNIANANYSGRYIFGGFETQTKPYTAEGSKILSVVSVFQNGGSMSTKSVYQDFPELSTGQYQAKITVDDVTKVGTLQLFDSKGQAVLIDSNGSDESATGGNISSTAMTFQYKAGATINTGRGILIELPKNIEGVTLNFSYKSGSEVNYQGDEGTIFSKVGYNQDIGINVPGSTIFSSTYRTIEGSKINTILGLPATAGTYFSKLDNANVIAGDSIKVGGIDHNGNPVGAAKVTSAVSASLDLTKASEKERTLTVTYADQLYKIVVPQGAYATSQDLANAINYQLKSAEYLGSLTNKLEATIAGNPKGINAEQYQGFIQREVGTFISENSSATKAAYLVDLSSQVSATSDGARMSFSTSQLGDNVRLAISGDTQNKLGFDNMTMVGFGKDTEFEIGYDFHKDTIQTISTKFDDVNLDLVPRIMTVDGKLVNIDLSVNSPFTLTAPNTYSFIVNGNPITIADHANLHNPATAVGYIQGELAAKVPPINDVTVTNINFDAVANVVVDVTVDVKSQKFVETRINSALNKAGFGFDVNASLQHVIDNRYDVTISKGNGNLNKETQITVGYFNPAGVPQWNVQTDTLARKYDANMPQKTLNDFTKFIENLYEQSVTATIKDGKIVLQDKRYGESRLSIDIRPQNQGATYESDLISEKASVMKGSYSGTGDNRWQIDINQEETANGQRNISLVIKDKSGNEIYNRTTKDYLGGGIMLPNGLTLYPGSDNVDLPADERIYIDLKSNSALSFGSIRVTEQGQNVDVFRSIKNLENALKYNIAESGYSEPSSWSNSGSVSNAVPYLNGTFTGTYNDLWTYNVTSDKNKPNMYIQNEFKVSTPNNVNYDATALGMTYFEIEYFDNDTGVQKTFPINIDLPPTLSSARDVQNYIIKELNNTNTSKAPLLDMGLSFIADGDKIQIKTGSGTKIANFALGADTQALDADVAALQRSRTSFILGLNVINNDPVADTTAASTVNVAGVSVTAVGGAATVAALATDLQTQLRTKNSNITVVDNAGVLEFRVGGQLVEATTSDPVNPFGIVLAADTVAGVIVSKQKILSSGLQSPITDLSTANISERTLNITTTDNSVPPQTKSLSPIILDQKKYADVVEMVADINRQLNRPDMFAYVTQNNTIGFYATPPNDVEGGFTVQGDYSGKLGFPAAGDKALIKVTSADGTPVQNIYIDTANSPQNVADGVSLGLNNGKILTTDSFTTAVGSGITREIGVLDSAEKQMLTAASTIGNRGSRVETIISFQETIIKSNEKVKSDYLGSTELDQAKALTDWNLATTAYQTSLTVVGKIMSISLLDFLR